MTTEILNKLSEQVAALEALEKSRVTGDKEIADKVFADKKFQEVLTLVENSTKAANAAETRTKELQDSLKELEATVLRPTLNNTKSDGVSEETIAAKNACFKLLKSAGFNHGVVNGLAALQKDASITPMEMKFLQEGSNVEGGYLVAPQYDNEVLKKITEISDMRSVARVSQMSSMTLKVATRETLGEAYWEGEAQEDTEDNSTYGQREFKAHTLSASVSVTLEELNDSYVNIGQQIMDDFAERFAQKEGKAFVRGGKAGDVQASNMPQGFLNAPFLNSINSGVVNSFSSDDLIRLTGQLKVGYTGVFGFNRQTLAYILAMKDGAGAYLWHPGADRGITEGAPMTLVGHRFIVLPDMDNFDAVGATPVVFADFYKGYRIVDRLGSVMLVDPYTKGNRRMVTYRNHRRLDGQVVLPEAFVLLNNS
jgi:HK97 family phage major capsid protein